VNVLFSISSVLIFLILYKMIFCLLGRYGLHLFQVQYRWTCWSGLVFLGAKYCIDLNHICALLVKKCWRSIIFV
jgi:hypothetical protein